MYSCCQVCLSTIKCNWKKRKTQNVVKSNIKYTQYILSIQNQKWYLPFFRDNHNINPYFHIHIKSSANKLCIYCIFHGQNLYFFQFKRRWFRVENVMIGVKIVFNVVQSYYRTPYNELYWKLLDNLDVTHVSLKSSRQKTSIFQHFTE